jgi:tetratricopeptide (TPR) repeat protein
MKTGIYILSLIFMLGFFSCNSSNNRNSALIDPNTRILNLNESLDYIDQLLEEDPSSSDLLIKKAEILYDLQFFEESFEIFSQIEKPINDTRFKILKIQIDLQNNRVDEALALAEHLYNNEGVESIELNEQLAYIYAEKKDYLKAIDHINYCMEKNARFPKYSYLKGLYYYNFKDTLNAYLYLERALDNGYKEMNGIILYSDLLLASNKLNEAHELISDNLTAEPENRKLKNALSKVYNAKRMYNNSKDISFELIDMGYQDSGPYLNLADVYLDTYKYDSAIYFAEKALEIDDQINQAYYILGKSHRAKEEIYEAYNAYSKVIEYDPGDPYALSEMQKLENYIAYLQRIKREYESRPFVPTLKPKSIENR